MHAAQAFSANATTFLTHIVGRGLDDERYVVERFHSRVDGDIRLVEAKAPKGKGRRKARHALASREEVKEMRPARNEIIVCTGLSIRNCGVQYWSVGATGLFHDRRQKG